MRKITLRKTSIERRKLRIRKRVTGTSAVPRLSVFRSSRYIFPQVIDDETGKTLVSISLTRIKELHKGKNKSEAAYEIGKELGKESTKKKIEKVVFDRGGYAYHGRVQKLADGAREGGLKF